MSNQAGKGDMYRKVDPVKYAANYDAIFGKKKKEEPKPKKEKAK